MSEWLTGLAAWGTGPPWTRRKRRRWRRRRPRTTWRGRWRPRRPCRRRPERTGASPSSRRTHARSGETRARPRSSHRCSWTPAEKKIKPIERSIISLYAFVQNCTNRVLWDYYMLSSIWFPLFLMLYLFIVKPWFTYFSIYVRLIYVLFFSERITLYMYSKFDIRNSLNVLKFNIHTI